MSGTSMLLTVLMLVFHNASFIQDSSKSVSPPERPQLVSDSTSSAQPATASGQAGEQKTSGSPDSIFERFFGKIDPADTLLGLAGLIIVGYLAYKRRQAELRAEREHRKRTELEERQREVETRLAVLEAERDFAEKSEKQKKSQRAKSAEERYLHMLENEVCQIHLAAPGIEGVPVSLLDTFVRHFAKYPVTNKQYRRFIRYLHGEESDQMFLRKNFLNLHPATMPALATSPKT